MQVSRIAEELGPAVAGIRDGGSGVFVAPTVLVTLARNVRDDTVLVRVAGKDQAAEVAGIDRSVDLAVLRADGPAVAEWAGEPPHIGQDVVALADPAGRGLRATRGNVSAAPRDVRGPSGRLIPGAVEHTAPLPRGSGGGPLVDAGGRVLGLNALRLDGGFLLAWPAAVLAPRAAALASGNATVPRRLGVALAGPRQTRRMRAAVGLAGVDGLLVREVEPDSPAARAGIAQGDVIVGANGNAVQGIDALHDALDAAGDGPLALELVRGTDELTVEVGP